MIRDNNPRKLRIPAFVLMHGIIPAYKTEDNALALVMSDPLNIIAIDDVRFYTGMEVIPLLCTKSSILHAIEVNYSKQYSQKVAEELNKEIAADQAAKLAKMQED